MRMKSFVRVTAHSAFSTCRQIDRCAGCLLSAFSSVRTPSFALNTSRFAQSAFSMLSMKPVAMSTICSSSRYCWMHSTLSPNASVCISSALFVLFADRLNSARSSTPHTAFRFMCFSRFRTTTLYVPFITASCDASTAVTSARIDEHDSTRDSLVCCA